MKILKFLSIRDRILLSIAVVSIYCQIKIDLILPEYTGKLAKIISQGKPSLSEVSENGAIMLLIAICSVLLSVFTGFLGAKVATSFSKNLREAVFYKVTDLSAQELKQFATSSLITRTTNDIVQVQTMITMGLQFIVKAPIMAYLALGKISGANVQWNRATFTAIIVMISIIIILLVLVMPKYYKNQKLTDKLNLVTREIVLGVRPIRAFNSYVFENKKIGKVNEEITKIGKFVSVGSGFLMPIMQVIMNFLTLSIYFIGAKLMYDAANSQEKVVLLGEMTAFTQYAIQVVMAFIMMVGIFMIMPKSIVSMRRINEVLKRKKEIVSGEYKVSDSVKGKVEFRNVSFSYEDSESVDRVVEGLNFIAPSGSVTAIIGSTGAGKTSLVNLIPRLYEVTDGKILIDDIDIRDYNLEELRSLISIASQKPSLLEGSIKENILYGSKEKYNEVDIDSILDFALKNSESLEFVKELDNGVDTRVAQGGINFSGGQKQRLSIARALFKNGNIMIFDDSFSALDYKTDKKVRNNILKYHKENTIIIIAQRIGTVKEADNIIVLDKGRIVGQGKHGELLENCQVYKEIALSQLSREELENGK